MELFFLLVLVVLMATALGAGFPVAFSLPGSAILTILLAAIFGFVIEGDVAAYFAHGDPVQWLSAGVTNLRGIYWDAEQDTLIAIPLFIFMGLMLERSKIAEDLLVTMGQLFGPIPGGVGISVVVVGALLAATTGIVGATVIAMGLISLPVMLRAQYSHALATGTIAASGTLGQIIPPSIVLIILADQLSNATDQGNTLRALDYKEGTGSITMPSEYALGSTSAGDMFLGALIPGLVLVGLYITFILVLSLIRPKVAPPAPYEGTYDAKFALRVVTVLVPPLTLIFVVLGSIIMGVATVNQAGAIGAAGALIMSGYRLYAGNQRAYWPAMLAVVSVGALVFLINTFDINVKNVKTQEDLNIVFLAGIACFGFLVSLFWSGKRIFQINHTLSGVMMETAKTTSLVFIILLGAAMLTAAFRAFGGEELVRDFLTGLPGGFYAKFVIVMIVIFILGFFLDFIEIAVVVVPIITPILLADPTANVTAVWLGVMIGVNMQTSFLTPPFGFALFYLRGVADKAVKTISMYKGVVPFITLQLVGLTIVGFYPPLVNYLPNRVFLAADTAPPPSNPRLQACIERDLLPKYAGIEVELKAAVARAKQVDTSFLPNNLKTSVQEGFQAADKVFVLVPQILAAEAALQEFIPGYRPSHEAARDVRIKIGAINRKIEKVEEDLQRMRREAEPDEARMARLQDRIANFNAEIETIRAETPEGWDELRANYLKLEKAENTARRQYRVSTDQAYEPIISIKALIKDVDRLRPFGERIEALIPIVQNESTRAAYDAVEALRKEMADAKIAGGNRVVGKLSSARRKLRGQDPKPDRAVKDLNDAIERFNQELVWRAEAKEKLLPELLVYEAAIRDTIGLRSQYRLPAYKVEPIANCLADHRDISLSF